jgi:hypothetical protein
MKTRYAITHLGRDGLRKLTFANQGRNHYDDHAEAARRLAGFIQNNPVETLRDIYGDQAIGTFEVTPVECYDHGDATRTVF